jgi:hypothetical protein
MKPLFFCVGLFLAFSITLYAQPPKVIKTDKQRNFENIFYQQVDVAVTKKTDTMKPTATMRAANYLVMRNVYPTEDVSQIIYELNKSRDASTFHSTEDTLAMPKFTALSPALVQKLQNDFVIAKKNDPATNQLFQRESIVFNDKYEKYIAIHQVRTPFIDTLTICSKRLIPAISNSSTSISRAKMEYFVKAMRNMNVMMNLLLYGTNKPVDNTVMRYPRPDGSLTTTEKQIEVTIEALVRDIWSAGVYKSRVMKAKLKSGVNYIPASFYLPLQSLMENPSNLEAYFEETDNPANAAIYVFVNDKGNQSDSAEVRKYQVYFGSNGLKYSLSFTKDTLSLFNFRPVNLASTLPLVLGTGNYCFVLRDVNSGKLEIRPDVNLVNEQAERDAKGLVIIPFIIFK